jgi:hypothetical protein
MMKILSFLVLVMMISGVTYAQGVENKTDSPQLVIQNLEVKYDKSDAPSYAPISEIPHTDRETLRNRAIAEGRLETGTNAKVPQATPIEPPSTPPPARKPIGSYPYTVLLTVFNASGKAVKAVEWDYITTDPTTRLDAHHKLRTKKHIKPGKTAHFVEKVRAPGVISASSRNQVEQRARILRIEYSDGSEWRRP